MSIFDLIKVNLRFIPTILICTGRSHLALYDLALISYLFCVRLGSESLFDATFFKSILTGMELLVNCNVAPCVSTVFRAFSVFVSIFSHFCSPAPKLHYRVWNCLIEHSIRFYACDYVFRSFSTWVSSSGRCFIFQRKRFKKRHF